MAVSKKISAQFRNHEVMIVNPDGTLEYHDVLNMDAGFIETADSSLPVNGCDRYYNKNNAGFTFVYNLSLPAQIEAENLKSLRRSHALKNIFSYDKEKGLNGKVIIVGLILALAIVF